MYKVLHVFSGFGGGISSLILNLTENKTADFQFDTLAFSYKNGEKFVERVQACGGRCLTMPRPRAEGVQRFNRYLNKVLQDGGYDVVHCHIAGWMSMPFYKAAKKQGVKRFLIHAHTTCYDSRIDRLPPVQAFNKQINFKQADGYMICSDLAGNYIFGEKYMEKKPTLLIPNGINEAAFTQVLTQQEKENLRLELGVAGNARLVGHVGRFTRLKNHDAILELAEAMGKKESDVRFVLVGDGECFDQVCEKIRQRKLEKTVLPIGRRGDVAKLMQLFDCMILPSLNEGLPTVAVECQAAGTPMVLSDTITRQCDMGMGLTAFLPWSDTQAWVDALCGFMDKKRCPEEGLKMARQKGFTAAAAGQLYCDQLRKLIEK